MESIEQLAHQGYEVLCKIIANTQLKQKNFAAGEYILAQGEAVKSLYWITLGEYTMHYTAENGKTFSLGQRLASDCILGELEYLTQTPCQFSVVASEDMQVKVIPLSLMNQTLSEHACVGIWLSRLLSISYQASMAKTMGRFLQPLLLTIATDMYDRFCQHQPLVDFAQVFREAERFGCSERAYRRTINQLVTEGFIKRIEHGYQIRDLDKFHNLLEKHSPLGDFLPAHKQNYSDK